MEVSGDEGLGEVGTPEMEAADEFGIVVLHHDGFGRQIPTCAVHSFEAVIEHSYLDGVQVGASVIGREAELLPQIVGVGQASGGRRIPWPFGGWNSLGPSWSCADQSEEQSEAPESHGSTLLSRCQKKNKRKIKIRITKMKKIKIRIKIKRRNNPLPMPSYS